MTKPVPPAPTQTDYAGSAAADNVPVPTTGGDPNDVWGLGDLYDQPVLLGVAAPPRHPIIGPGVRSSGPVGGGLIPGVTTPPLPDPNNYGKTQDLMQHMAELWASQSAEKAKYPKRLTTYEQLQRSLWQAGFYGQTSLDSVHVGQWTAQTEQAMTSALGTYEHLRNGDKLPITFTEFLTQNSVMGKDGGQNAPTATAPKDTSISVTDPAAIRSAAQSAAQAALGKGLSSGQLDQFVAQFQSAQASATTAMSGQVSIPDLSSQADAFAQQADPHAYHQNQRDVFLSSLVNLLAPPGAALRPNMTPTPSAGG